MGGRACRRLDVLHGTGVLQGGKTASLLLSLGETDDWGHAGRYDEYLAAARRADGYLRTLWEPRRSMPQYQGKTTLIFSTDHGRGEGLSDWRDHGEKVKGAEFIWMGFLGPDTPALGERADVATVTQGQVAFIALDARLFHAPRGPPDGRSSSSMSRSE